jgi:hypothetical protein
MSLERIDREVRREERGFSFSMRIAGSGQDVRVFVADDALDDQGLAPGVDDRRAQFDADEQAFEEIASDRHTHGRVAASGFISITLADLVGIVE